MAKDHTNRFDRTVARPKRRTTRHLTLAGTMGLLVARIAAAQTAATDWPIHSMERPVPPVVKVGPAPLPVRPPSDAVVLFDGRTLAGWEADSGRPARWLVKNGVLEVTPQAGNIHTTRGFGDQQLHIEWRTPVEPLSQDTQDNGNSGVFLMRRYEVQVLESSRNRTYADGMAGAIYGQFPPMVNASRGQGEWQSYDIVFTAPRFTRNGTLLSPARMTVLHNGVLIHDDVTLTGPTGHHERPPYAPHDAKLPLLLQDHGHRVQYRNIWVRDLAPRDPG